MLANLAMSIIDKERVTTTLPRAKEVRGVIERLITIAKRNNLHSIRVAAKTVRDKTLLKKLFDVITPRFKDRNGGYVRVIKTGDRKGDNAPLCMIEFVGTSPDIVLNRMKKKKVEGAQPAGKERADAKDAKDAKDAEPQTAAAAPAGKKDTADAVEKRKPAKPKTAKKTEKKNKSESKTADKDADADADAPKKGHKKK
jgi:large subunit ribosomal protein L17